MPTTTRLVLSIFPGIDLLGRAFEEVFGSEICLVRGPDVLWGGDVREFHPPSGHFWGVIGGPPCQAHSRMANIARHRGFHVRPDLIPEFCRVVDEARPEWFLMENVPQAPLPTVEGYVVRGLELDNHWLGEEQTRRRRVSFGTCDGRALAIDELVCLESCVREPAVLAGAGRAIQVKIGGSGKLKSTWSTKRFPREFSEAVRLQGLPADFLDEAPFTAAGKQKVVGNGVPLPMGRAVARAVRRAMEVHARD